MLHWVSFSMFDGTCCISIRYWPEHLQKVQGPYRRDSNKCIHNQWFSKALNPGIVSCRPFSSIDISMSFSLRKLVHA